MAIIEPETDINLWISIISQSIHSPEELNHSLPSLKTVFQEVIENPNSLQLKYKITAQNFYRSIVDLILIPVLKIEKFNCKNNIDSLEIFTEILNEFVKFSILSLSNDDSKLNEIVLLLFNKQNKLYQINNSFYDNVCKNFIRFQLFSKFLDYLKQIPDLNKIQSNDNEKITKYSDSEFISFADKITFIVISLISCIFYIEDKSEITWKTISIQCMLPLLKIYRFINDKIAYSVFTSVLGVMIFYKQIDSEILNLWVTIFELYLKTDNFSLIYFTLVATYELIKRKELKKSIFSIFKQKQHSNIINLYLNVPINEDFCKFLQEIYSSFLVDGLINIDELETLWKNQSIVHISTLSSLLSIFVSIANVVPDDSIERFTDIILSANPPTIEWLKCVTQISLVLNSRKQDISKFKSILTQISNRKFNLDKTQEIELFKNIADEALPQLLLNSFDKSNYLHFLKSILAKINSQKETNNDIETLSKSLPGFGTGGKNIDVIQELFEKIIYIFPKYNIMTMKHIIDILASEKYGCKFNEQLLKQLLSFANHNISSEIYSLVSELCIQKNRISIDSLLNVMVNSNLEINSSFYKTIKLIVLKLNNQGDKIDNFPLNKEDIIWHFCYIKSQQTLRFHKLLSRLYLRNTTSDKEMIESFISNSIKWFKKFYFQKENTQNMNSEIIDLFSNCLYIFLDKFESLLYVPYNYHFSEHKTNKINISITLESSNDKNNKQKITFSYDQRRTVSSLIQYIQTTAKINSDLLIKYQNKPLDEKKTIEEEIGKEKLNPIKESNQPLQLTFSIGKTNKYRQSRTFLPSLYIINNIKGLSNILFQSRTYPKVFYKLPTFNETIMKIQSLKSEDFQTFFPYDKPIQFHYNFESYLDFISSKGDEFSLTENENFDDSYHESFIKESGLIDYLINCGLSTSFVPLIQLILVFIKDYYNSHNETVIDNEILSTQLLSLIEGFYNQDQTSCMISSIFSMKFKSLPSLSRDLLFHLFSHRYSSFRKEARMFLKDVQVPLSFYAYAREKWKNEPYEEFYLSMADHIYISPKRDDKVIEIIIRNFNIKNPYTVYLTCIDSALRKNMFNQKELENLANYIANSFVIEQMCCLPKFAFDEAMQIASYFKHPLIINAFDKLFNQFDFTDHLKRAKNDGLIDGEQITFRESSFSEPGVNYKEFPIGLTNLGMTCYVNSVLQQLFNINDFRNSLVEKPTKSIDAASSLSDLFYALGYSYNNVANPSAFIQKYGGIDVNVQCDCCEFLQNLLARLKVNLFNICLKSTITATKDDKLKFDSVENFAVLPLPIRNISNLNESFKHFLSVDHIKNFAFTSGIKADAKKAYFFESVSDHLIIQLKRFEYNHQTKKCEKITSKFEFNKILNIGNESFQLKGIITHIGQSADSGHYISYSRRFHSNQWFEYNDSKVSRVNEQTVMENGFKDGYLLFFAKKDSDKVTLFSNDDIKNQNRYEIVCRMIFSRSFCNTMIQLCKSMNSSNLNLFKLSIFYFFQLLPIYKNQNYQSQFGSALLSKCQKSNDENDDFPTTILFIIFEYWSAIKMENALLYSEFDAIKQYSCEILKLVVNQIECIEEIEKMVSESSKLWFYYLYSSSKFFELINFAFEKYSSKMIQNSRKNHWDMLFESLFISILQYKKKISMNNLDLHYIIQIFNKIGFTDKFINEFYNNIDFVPLLLNSKTPIDDILIIINKLKRKKEAIELLNGIKPKTQPLEILLSKLC